MKLLILCATYRHVLDRLCLLTTLRILASLGLLLGSVAPLIAHAQVAGNPFNYSRASAFEYNANGFLIAEIIEPDNPQLCVRTEYTYDSYGNRSQTLTKNCSGAVGAATFNARSSSVSYASNAVNLVPGQFATTSTNALGHTETKQYDNRFGAVTQLTGPNGLTTQWQYDSFGRKTLEVRADGTRTVLEYAYCNAAYGSPAVACTSLSSANPATLAYVVTTTPQDRLGVPNGPASKTYFDTLGRAVRQETQRADNGSWVYSETLYDALGQIAKKSEPTAIGSAATLFTTYTYDALGRVVQESHPDASAPLGQATSSIAYDGRRTTTTNARGQTQTKEQDPQGRLTRVTDHQDNQIAYQYDAFGNLLKTIDPLGNSTTLSYDIRGRKIAMNDPDMGRWNYVYNALGELVSQTDAKNQTTQMQYDLLGRLIAKLEPTQKNYWAYDKYADGSACSKGLGKLCETWADNGYRQRREYDSLGRSIKTTTIQDRTYISRSSYDTNGRIATQTWPSGVKIRHTYNSLGLLTNISDGLTDEPYWTALEYNVRGQLTRFQYGNSIETVQTYTADTGRLTAIQAGPGYGVQNQQYQFDSVGNLTQRLDLNTAVSEAFTYDDLNRLANHSVFANATTRQVSFSYNALGNLLNQSEIGAYSYNLSGVGSTRPHAVTQVSGTVGPFLNPQYNYDANGNLASVTSTNGNRRDHTFTSFNTPEALGRSSAAANGNGAASAAFVYGTDQQRVKSLFARNVDGVVKTRTVYHLHPDNAGGLFYEREIQEDGTVLNKHYIAGSILVLSRGDDSAAANITQIRYWHKDHLGSIAVVTDEAGLVVERLAYDPFGQRRFADGRFDASVTLAGLTTARGFTGHEHLDDLDFIHMNGRVYDPVIGRFLSADPFIQFADNLQSYNRYSYLFNNPLNAIDPTGYFLGGLFKGIRHAVSSVFKTVEKLAQPIISIGAAVGCSVMTGGVGTAACIGIAQVGISKAFGASWDQALKSGLIAGATAWGFQSVGDWFPGAGQFGSNSQTILLNTLGHAAVGCASAAAGGGNCGQGALAAGVSGGFGNYIGYAHNMLLATVQSAIVGGTASVLGGGNFANGAVTGAFGYLFNQMAHLRGARDRSFYAAKNGAIETVGWENPNNYSQGYGFRLKLRADGDGSLFVYAHVDPNSLTVSQGDWVTQGQLLGQYANPANGGATGPHLHFEWWSASGKRLDPGQYLSTVMPNYQQTDFIRFRDAHPVTGKARMHNGYDLIGPAQ